MWLVRRVLALLERFDSVMREWKRQDQLNTRSYQLHRRGFLFNQKSGRVTEAVPSWMVVKHEPKRQGEAGSGAGAGEAKAHPVRKRSGPADVD